MGLHEIYNALADIDLSIGGVTVPVRTPGQMKNSFSSADLPVRILVPLSADSEGQGLTAVTFGATATVNWQITEYLLYKPETSRGGLDMVLPVLLTYANDYVDAIRQNSSLLEGVTVEDLRVDWGLYNYPSDINLGYFGVGCRLSVRELRG